MASLQSVAGTHYTVFKDALANQRYRDVSLELNTMARGAIQIALYNSAAMANDSANMTAALTELEDIYQESIDAPALIISGLESEGATGYGVAVTAGVVNTITFPLSLSSTNYALFVTPYDANGDPILGYKFYTKLVTGFSMEVSADGFIDYRAILA